VKVRFEVAPMPLKARNGVVCYLAAFGERAGRADVRLIIKTSWPLSGLVPHKKGECCPQQIVESAQADGVLTLLVQPRLGERIRRSDRLVIRADLLSGRNIRGFRESEQRAV